MKATRPKPEKPKSVTIRISSRGHESISVSLWETTIDDVAKAIGDALPEGAVWAAAKKRARKS
jgi:hypothetical protein